MLVEDKIHWVELDQEQWRNKWQTVFPAMKSVAPSSMRWLYRKDSVGPKTTNRWNRVRCRENTCPLSSLRLVRSHKDLQGIYWKMCKEFDAENAEQTERNLDEVFFERGNTYAWDKCKNSEKNTWELHLEMVGDKVTYVRVYWLRSQVRSLDHRSYSSFKLKMGLPFFV